MKQLLFIAALLGSFAANAASFSFTGNLASDSDHQLFTFTVSQETDIAIRTLGFAGGTNSAGQTISAGGFDPMIALFAMDGTFIATNDDCTSDPANDCDDFLVDYDEDWGDFAMFDSLLDWELDAGTYIVALALYGQDLQQMPSLGDIIWTGYNNFNGRSSAWALDISGEFVSDATTNPSQVPVPAAVWLFGSALMGLTGIKRRKSA